ncbi:hypothetical protein [Pseudobacteriovorax antillogorgiicola]|uniref:Lipoprotein n=1 Tax=Pseudobacteriovorax antillogorgiicola TaxID=1513793 RepID=A0A1Y6C956_9BACT|nr:hypothetical protein [Pseudobacteriovorax antillogorgiicola]TCS49847.1 hypothetical protein EDD56_11492 [Pseudobacteriovorax antillogorgiicola]SMF43681.1 hypothetical protein SAMN06296036_11391 [Pseudobacteriovorax antillogorgiicola]
MKRILRYTFPLAMILTAACGSDKDDKNVDPEVVQKSVQGYWANPYHTSYFNSTIFLFTDNKLDILSTEPHLHCPDSRQFQISNNFISVPKTERCSELRFTWTPDQIISLWNSRTNEEEGGFIPTESKVLLESSANTIAKTQESIAPVFDDLILKDLGSVLEFQNFIDELKPLANDFVIEVTKDIQNDFESDGSLFPSHSTNTYPQGKDKFCLFDFVGDVDSKEAIKEIKIWTPGSSLNLWSVKYPNKKELLELGVSETEIERIISEPRDGEYEIANKIGNHWQIETNSTRINCYKRVSLAPWTLDEIKETLSPGILLK